MRKAAAPRLRLFLMSEVVGHLSCEMRASAIFDKVAGERGEMGGSMRSSDCACAVFTACGMPLFLAAACQDRPMAQNTAPIGDVISAVKCELALYARVQQQEQERRKAGGQQEVPAGRLDLRAATIVLTLKAVNLRSGSGSVGAGAGVIETERVVADAMA